MNSNFEWQTDLDPEGLAEALEELQSTLTSELESAVKDIGVRVQSTAARAAPVDEGRLRGSIEMVVDRISKHLVRVEVGSNVEYAPHQEFGTIMHEAQPYLRPALEENRKWIVNRIEEAVDSAFNSAGLGGGLL